MRVTVRLFARLRELAGRGELVCEVGEAATIGDVWQAVAAQCEALAPYARSISVARNAEYARMTAAVREGDEVAFLPPVSGG